jgi:hypothetical protein
MIEADAGCKHLQEMDQAINAFISQGSSLSQLDFRTFQREYWPHFPQAATKRLGMSPIVFRNPNLLTILKILRLYLAK